MYAKKSHNPCRRVSIDEDKEILNITDHKLMKVNLEVKGTTT